MLEEVRRRRPRRREYREPQLNGGYMKRKDGVLRLAQRGVAAIGG